MIAFVEKRIEYFDGERLILSKVNYERQRSLPLFSIRRPNPPPFRLEGRK
jgi:hypothetical protein